MKFLLDENIELRLIPYLKELGYDVTRIGNDYPSGLLDHEVLAIAYKERRILITNDRSDFGDLIFRLHHSHSGVILFRIRSGDLHTKQAQLSYVLQDYANNLQKHFFVVTQHKVRVRATDEKAAA